MTVALVDPIPPDIPKAVVAPPALSLATPELPFTARNARFVNRDLSWLSFNARVLRTAQDPQIPLLERVRFLQIFTSNLDEFFMKRVGSLKRQLALGVDGADASGLTVQETLRAIRLVVAPLVNDHATCFSRDILPALNSEGIFLLGWDDLHEHEKPELESHFERNLFPVLTPLAFDPGHPFPFISNLSSSLGVLLRNPRPRDIAGMSAERADLFTRVKVPNGLVRLKTTSGNGEVRFIPIRDVIHHFIDRLFPGMDLLATMGFSITRNSDVQRDEEEADDLLRLISEELRERRFAKVIRLEHGPDPVPEIRDFLKHELKLSEDDIYQTSSHIDVSDLGAIAELQRPELRFRPWRARTPEALRDDETSMFSVIREQDLLVHHPYESFHHTVERFIREAVDDPKVIAIKMVVYRTGSKSPFIPLLIRAAEAGKQVVCIVEIKARFDEERNIEVAKALEKAGVHVVYGVVGLKTHCKLALVIRDDDGEVRSYAHVGTGNYNPSTSQLYTDFGLFTARPEVTRDITHVFHYLTGRSLYEDYKHLLVAPLTIRPRFLELIRNEERAAREGRPARIVAKMNSLEDRDIIEALYAASQAGVKIDLVVRGVCCLRPGVAGLSENIRVVSIIGRFLEHSRVYFFQNGASDPLDGLFYMGSADWMRRNLSFRVEVLASIQERKIKAQLWQCLEMNLSDHHNGWRILGDGNAEAPPMSCNIDVHDVLDRHYESQRRLRVR